MSDAGKTETKDWTVTEVRTGKVKNNPHGGQLQAFYVDFEGSSDVYWQRKAGNNPQVGESYYGYIGEGEYGPRFYQEKLPEDYNGSANKGGSTEYVAAPVNGANYARPQSPEVAAILNRTEALKVLAPAIVEAGGLNNALKLTSREIEDFIAEAGQTIPTKDQVAEAVEMVKETFPSTDEIPAEEPADALPFD